MVESTGSTTQVRTSYLPSEILWAHRLTPLMTYKKENGQYRIDYSQFHSVDPVKMSDCSARQLATADTTSDDLADDDHQGYFTSHAVHYASSTSTNRHLNAIRKVRSSLQQRRRQQRQKAAALRQRDADVVCASSENTSRRQSSVVEPPNYSGSGKLDLSRRSIS